MSLTRKAGAAIVTVALFALAMLMYRGQPDLRARDLDPIRTSGRIGHVVTNNVFSFKVDRVDVARSLRRTTVTPGPDTRTDGIFVIVYAQARSNRKPYRMAAIRLETDGGYTYEQAGRSVLYDSTFQSFEPLLWKRTTMVFEVPRNRLAGARVVVGESSFWTYPTAETAVDLGFDGRKAAEAVAHPAESYEIRRT